MHLWHINLEFWFTLGLCCQISRFMLMWRVQGGLSLPAMSHERRVMHPASPHPLCQYAKSPRRILLRSLSVTVSLSGSPHSLCPCLHPPLYRSPPWRNSGSARSRIGATLTSLSSYARIAAGGGWCGGFQRRSTAEGKFFYCCPFHKVS